MSRARWPSRPIIGLKLHKVERRSRRRMQSLWNQWRLWRKLECEIALWREVDKTWRWVDWWRKRIETNLAKSEDLFAESNGIQENWKLRGKGTAKPILPRTKRGMSSLVEPKITRKEYILSHDDARTNGGDMIAESSERIRSRWTLYITSQKRWNHWTSCC